MQRCSSPQWRSWPACSWWSSADERQGEPNPMKEFLNDWGLILTIFLPLVGALVMLVIPKDAVGAIKSVALAAPVAAAVLGVLLLIDFDYDAASQLQYVVDKSWIDLINSRFILGLDGLSLPLLALTLGIMPLVVIYSWNHIPSPGNPK